jgi:uncharacterized protein (TIGR02444 family)
MAGENAAEKDRGEALWRFALEVYRKPGVADACLLLQDWHGCNVPLLLFAAWAGAECCVLLTADEVAAAGNAVGAWHGEVVEALRTVRRRLKHGPPPAPDEVTGNLRSRLQAIEIEAERIELETLARCLPERRVTVMAEAGSRAGAESTATNLALAAALPGSDAESSGALQMIAGAALSP